MVLLLLGTERGGLRCTSSPPPQVRPAPSLWLAGSLLVLPIYYKSVVGLLLIARAVLHLGMRSISGCRAVVGRSTCGGDSAALPPCTSPHGACCSWLGAHGHPEGQGDTSRDKHPLTVWEHAGARGEDLLLLQCLQCIFDTRLLQSAAHCSRGGEPNSLPPALGGKRRVCALMGGTAKM